MVELILKLRYLASSASPAQPVDSTLAYNLATCHHFWLGLLKFKLCTGNPAAAYGEEVESLLQQLKPFPASYQCFLKVLGAPWSKREVQGCVLLNKDVSVREPPALECNLYSDHWLGSGLCTTAFW